MSDSERVLVRFFEDSWENPAKSAAAGRKIFDTVDWCEIKVPGENDNTIGPVHRFPGEDPRTRFPSAWAAYQKDRSSEGLVGTPLTEVPWLGRGEVQTFKASGIKTVEALAGVNDANVTTFPGGLALRQKARDWLKAAADSAPMQRMSEELAARDAKIKDLENQMRELIAERRKKGS